MLVRSAMVLAVWVSACVCVVCVYVSGLSVGMMLVMKNKEKGRRGRREEDKRMRIHKKARRG